MSRRDGSLETDLRLSIEKWQELLERDMKGILREEIGCNTCALCQRKKKHWYNFSKCYVCPLGGCDEGSSWAIAEEGLSSGNREMFETGARKLIAKMQKALEGLTEKNDDGHVKT